MYFKQIIKDAKEKKYDQFLKDNNYSFLKKNFFYNNFIIFKKGILIFSLFLIFTITFDIVTAPLTLASYKSNNFQKLDPETQKKKESLEAELQKILKQIEEYKKTVNKIRKEKTSVKNEISIVESQIKKIELEIKAINLSIEKLNKRINETKNSIKIIGDKIERSKDILEAAIRYYYQLKEKNILEVFLAEISLSDYFNDFIYIQRLQDQINNEIDNLKNLNDNLNQQKIKLENDLEEQNNLLTLQKLKYNELQELKKEKNKLLAQINQKEEKYKKLLDESEKTAAKIREQIYNLAGGGKITFGDAYNLAKIAEKYTNIRPAFLLAILHYESRLGQNVGNCNYKDAMKPSEQSLFEKIVIELGLDPNKMPVSCKPWYGWGGAMGPAQFIPSTWLAYKDRVAKITGNNPPSPWNNLDAFIAAALKLTDNGAASRRYQDEWKAAMIYFAGSNWANPSLRFYGDDVMAIAERFQRDIEILEKGQ
jgi:peptidoglycan hydrolase CwlO-like protein